MEIKNRLFPYPVLSDETDDYVKGKFGVDTKVTEEIGSIHISFDIHLENNEMLDLIRMGEAEYVIHLECISTAFRKALKTDINQLSYRIPKDRVNNEISVLAMVVAKKKIENYFSSDWNEDYEGTSVVFEKAAILAYRNLPKIYISKNYEELAENESLFSVVKMVSIDKEEEKPITFDLNGDRIKILVDEATYNAYIRFQHSTAIALSLLVLPAVTYMIEELRVDFDIYHSKRWFLKLSGYFKSMGENFKEIIDSDKNAVELAQEMLKYPIGKTYEQLLEQGE